MVKLLAVVVGAALIALAVLALSVVRARRPLPLTTDGPISSWQIPSMWTVSRGHADGKPMFGRFNTALAPLAGRAEFSTRIGVAVPLNDPTEDGLPQGAEFAELNEMEDLLERRLTAGNESLLAGVITTNGMREYVLYSSNAGKAIEKIQQVAAELPHHTLQWIVDDDPQWQVFRGLTGR